MSLLITEAVAQVQIIEDAFDPPTGLTITPGDRQFTLTWTHPSDVAVSDIYSYEITAMSDSGSTLYTATPTNHSEAFTNNPSFTRQFLNNGTKLTVRIRGNTDPPGPEVWEGKWSSWVSGTPNMPAPTDFTATLDAPTIGDRTVTLSWTAIPQLTFSTSNRDVTGYEYSQNGGAWTPIGSTNTFYTVTGLKNGIQYAFRVRGVRAAEVKGLPSRTVTVRPLIDAPRTPGTLNVQRDDDTATLTWSPPSEEEEEEAPITRYEYSDDGGSTWKSTGSTDTTYTVTGLKAGETYTFLVRAVYVDGGTSRIISPRSSSSNAAVLSIPKPKRKIILQCPVGWQRTDGFAGRTRRALLYEVNLQMDLQSLGSIYKPIWVAIYVHPDEALENLDGWKLKVAVPYNLHREYPLTAENSVVVDANIEGIEGGFAFIESPAENPFPMIGMGFTGAHVPGFDYRLYDDTGRKVDFGIACYKQGGIFQALKEMEDPRVLRNVPLETLDWDAATYIRSEWTVPVPAPAAPSLIKKTIVGTWADLKKQ